MSCVLDPRWWWWCYTSAAEEVPGNVRNGSWNCGGECHGSPSPLSAVKVWQADSAGDECQWQCHKGLLDFELSEDDLA